MAIGLGKKRLAKNENPEHGQHPKQHAQPDGTDDPDLRSLSKNLKIQVARLGGAAGQLAEPQQDDAMGKTRPMPVVWLEGAHGEVTGAGAASFAALRRPVRNQTTACQHKRLAEMDAAGVALQSGFRIDELPAHRDVLTGASD